jgi:hypothetical protein
MRAIGLALGLAGWIALMPFPILAQQRPVYGCNAAPSCRPLGVAGLNSNLGVSGVFFGMGMAWGPGFNIHIVAPNVIPLFEKKASPVEGELFHLRVSLLPPMPFLTPAPAPPTPTVAPR